MLTARTKTIERTGTGRQFPPSLASLSATKFSLQIYMELTVWTSVSGPSYLYTQHILSLRLRSHGTGRIRDRTQIRPVTAVHTKPDKLQAKKCSHGAGRIRARNYLLNLWSLPLAAFFSMQRYHCHLQNGDLYKPNYRR